MRVPEIPEFVPISVIVSFSGQPARNVQQWAVEGKVPKSDGKKGYPFLRTVTAIRELLSQRDGGTAAELAEYKRIQAKADSESAQIDAARKKGELVFQADAEAVNRDYRVKVERVIQSSDFIARPLRERLGVAISKIKVEAIPNAGRDKK